MQMPQPFDITLAIARLDYDRTDHLRQRYPHLAWVWDELDDLRARADEMVCAEDHAALEKECGKFFDELDSARQKAESALEMLEAIEDTTNPIETRAIIQRAYNKLWEIIEP